MNERLTAKQVQTDIMALLRGSELANEVNGSIYRSGYRPRDSKKEDIVVIFTSGVPDQIETGVVTINIFVPDIKPYRNGVFVENGKRTEQLEALAQEWVEDLTTDRSSYKFHLQRTIYTEAEPDTQEHFVVVRLEYQYYGGGINERVLATDPTGYAILCDPQP